MRKNTSIHEKAGILRDAIFAANDGVITTFAVVAGVAGASLSTKIVLILGFANLFADGVSMASGSYLGVESESDFEKLKGKKGLIDHSPIRHSVVVFVSFIVAGLLPLMPYLTDYDNKFSLSILVVGISLFVMGMFRGRVTKKNMLMGGVQMLFVGGIAAVVAFMIGFFLDKYIL